MNEIVTQTGNLEQDLKAITALVQKRGQYRRGGKPCPTELTNVSEFVSRLDAMVPILKKRINAELATLAISQMQQVVANHQATVLQDVERGAVAITKLDELMPQTISEQLLIQVLGTRFAVLSDAEQQRHARWNLHLKKYCRTDCWYPDVCKNTRYRDNCVLKHLSYVVEAPWYRRLFLGQRFQPAEPYSASALRSIRESMYYDNTQERRLKRFFTDACLYEPQICRHWAIELIGLRDDRCRICGKRGIELMAAYKPPEMY